MKTISFKTLSPGSAGASISIPSDSMSWISACPMSSTVTLCLPIVS